MPGLSQVEYKMSTASIVTIYLRFEHDYRIMVSFITGSGFSLYVREPGSVGRVLSGQKEARS